MATAASAVDMSIGVENRVPSGNVTRSCFRQTAGSRDKTRTQWPCKLHIAATECAIGESPQTVIRSIVNLRAPPFRRLSRTVPVDNRVRGGHGDPCPAGDLEDVSQAFANVFSAEAMRAIHHDTPSPSTQGDHQLGETGLRPIQTRQFRR